MMWWGLGLADIVKGEMKEGGAEGVRNGLHGWNEAARNNIQGRNLLGSEIGRSWLGTLGRLCCSRTGGHVFLYHLSHSEGGTRYPVIQISLKSVPHLLSDQPAFAVLCLQRLEKGHKHWPKLMRASNIVYLYRTATPLTKMSSKMSEFKIWQKIGGCAMSNI